jgi:hypothetical protein
MRKPLKKLPKPVPQEVTIRRVGHDDPVEVVQPDELARRKEEAEWQRWRRTHGYDVWGEHRLLALQLGDTITVPRYSIDIWWFVRDVNGIDRTITAGTFIFDQVRERSFPFEMVEVLDLSESHDINEATWWWNRLRAVLPARQKPADRAA